MSKIDWNMLRREFKLMSWECSDRKPGLSENDVKSAYKQSHKIRELFNVYYKKYGYLNHRYRRFRGPLYTFFVSEKMLESALRNIVRRTGMLRNVGRVISFRNEHRSMGYYALSSKDKLTPSQLKPRKNEHSNNHGEVDYDIWRKPSSTCRKSQGETVH